LFDALMMLNAMHPPHSPNGDLHTFATIPQCLNPNALIKSKYV
jgi:hypothetical protein